MSCVHAIWHHAECVDMSDEVYKVAASQCEALHWFCGRCNVNVVKILKTVGKVQKK